MSPGGVWGGTGPRPDVSLSVNRLTSMPWAAFPVTSYDSITPSEVKAKLFQKGQNKGNQHSPPEQRLSLGIKQQVRRSCRQRLLEQRGREWSSCSARV